MRRDLYKNIQELLAHEDSDRYDDIIDMERPISNKHKPMNLNDRAAQFAPFSALTGYEDAIREEARVTSSRREISKENAESINKTIIQISREIENYNNVHREDLSAKRVKVRICYFLPDEFKTGGEYVEEDARIRAIKKEEDVIVLADYREIMISDILDIEIL